MIYVIKSSAYKKGTDEKEYEDIIKIGYTREKSNKSRFNTYITENPTMRVLYLIDNGTRRDEKNLHYYFKRYRKYGNEWFEFTKEIIDFFETHKTKESLEEINNWTRLSRSESDKARENKRNNPNKSLFIQVASKELTPLTSFKESSISNYLWFNLDNLEKTIEEHFPGKYKDIEERYQRVIEEENEIKKLGLGLQQAYDYLLSEFNRDNNFERRMKLLGVVYFQYPEFYTKYANSPLLCMIPIEYQNYINILGFERIKALGYRESDISREIETLNNLTTIDISSIFSIGERYTNKYIKETLGEFYKVNNIHKTPKASDLDEYFILKSIKLKVDDKWEHGFEIIGKK